MMFRLRSPAVLRPAPSSLVRSTMGNDEIVSLPFAPASGGDGSARDAGQWSSSSFRMLSFLAP